MLTYEQVSDGYYCVTTNSSTGYFDFLSSLIPSVPGDQIKYSVDIKSNAPGKISAKLVPHKNATTTISWNYGTVYVSKNNEWSTYTSTAVLPIDSTGFTLRIRGDVPAEVEFRNFCYENISHFNLPEEKNITLENNYLKMTFNTKYQNFNVFDKTSGNNWNQQKNPTTASLVNIVNTKSSIDFDLIGDITSFHVSLTLSGNEIISSISSSDFNSEDTINFPANTFGHDDDYIIVPQSEGMAYPCSNSTIAGSKNPAYNMGTTSMPFIGMTNQDSYMMIIFDTPFDAYCRIFKDDSIYGLRPEWFLSKGKFSYTRTCRYAYGKGSHVQMAKHYQKRAKDIGRWVPFNEKVKTRPDIDRLVGAANIWFISGRNYSRYYEEMYSLGMDKLLASQAESNLNYLNITNNLPYVLSSKYDFYRAVMNESYLSYFGGSPISGWTQEAWPDGIIITKTGEPMKGWEYDVEGLSERIAANVLCDTFYETYAPARLQGEIDKGIWYRTRFLDTTMSGQYNECYDERHPLDKVTSASQRVKLLKVFSDRGLVVGTEDGRDAAVPVCDYFEGMMSPGAYRVPDSGRYLEHIYYDTPELITKFQVNESIRVPLFELVYHGCAVSYWYWCDQNNKVESVWHKRDLFNMLYGTPPMYVLSSKM